MNAVVWMLRLPFLGIIYAVVIGIVENFSTLSHADLAMYVGGICLCVGVCVAAGLLKKPMPAETQTKIYNRM